MFTTKVWQHKYLEHVMCAIQLWWHKICGEGLFLNPKGRALKSTKNARSDWPQDEATLPIWWWCALLATLLQTLSIPDLQFLVSPLGHSSTFPWHGTWLQKPLRPLPKVAIKIEELLCSDIYLMGIAVISYWTCQRCPAVHKTFY